jgi:tetratricopeptide (TPR) repeat protein
MTVNYFQLANKLNHEGKLEEAIAHYYQAIEFNPDFYLSHHNLGEVLAKLGRWDEAVHCYSRAIETNPNSAWSYYNQAEAFVKLERWEQAIACYHKAKELKPDASEIIQPEHWELFYQLGNLYLQRNQPEEARVAYNRAIQINNDALEVYQSLLQLQPDNWQLWLQLGNLHLKQKHTEKARVAYLQVIKLNPDSVKAYENLLQIEPENSEIWCELANLYVRQNQPQQAKEAYLRVTKLNPNFYEAYNNLGKLLIEEGKLVEATAIFQQAIAINPKLAEAYYNLGNVRFQLSQFDLAIQSYEQASEIQPDLAEALLKLVPSLRINNELDKATYCCQRVIEINPNSVEGHFQLANLLIMQGKHDEALRRYYHSNKIKFNEARAQGEIGTICLCSLPKSGTVYIAQALQNGLNIPGSPTDLVECVAIGLLDYYWKIKSPEIYTKPVSCVITVHTNPHEWNQFTTVRIVDRLLVNVRDPRQALVSWVDHLNRTQQSRDAPPQEELFFKLKSSPPDYFSKSITEQINHEIESGFLPKAIKWIEGWLDAEENPSFYPKILFTQQEELVTNPKALFDSILKFYEIETTKFTFPEPPKFLEGTHYRKGRTDEWREVFTPEQIEKASSLMPARLLDRFGWKA